MSKKTFGSILLAAALSLCFGSFAFGQEVTGSIVGTVRDASGSVVPGATVTITDPSKGGIVVRTATTNDSGEFSAPNLTISTYTVTVEAANFKKSVSTDVKLDVGQRRTVDVNLEAGRIDEVVTVEADPIAVDLTSPTSGTVISGDQIRELSTNNRNFLQLVTLAPGVSNDLSDQIYVGTTNPAGQANTVNISVNGARSSQNTFTVDGADITDRGSNITIQAYPSLDSIGEFKVLRSLYPAEAGRSGGGQVNVVTRSGTSKFRGSAYYFFRNETLNANDPFTNSTPGLATRLGRDDNGKIKRAPFRYKNYGWTLGGPIYFFNFGEHDEGMFRKYDRTFFFFSQEWRDDRRSSLPPTLPTVPTQNQRLGEFDRPICIQTFIRADNGQVSCDPQFPGQNGTTPVILPANTPISTLRPINPVAQQYIDQIYSGLPLPNTSVANQLAFPLEGISEFRQEIIKIDHSFNDKASGYYRYQRDSIPTIDPNALFSSGSGLPDVSTTSTDSPGRTHTVQLTYAATPRLIFEGRYTFGYGAILSRNIGLLSLERSSISSPLPYQNQRDRIPTITGNGFSGLQSFGPYDNFSWKGNISGTATWITGNHTFKFGAVYSKYRKNENALAGNNEGIFSGFNTPGAAANVIAPGGNTTQQLWANFLMGTNVSLTQASFDYTADLRQKAFEAFAQDEWRFRSNLTLYLGVRYSFFGSPWDKNGRLTNFVPELWNPSAAPLVTGAGNRVPGTGNYCNGLIHNAQNVVAFPNCTTTPSPWGKFILDVSKKDFAPRVGFAWDPFKNGTTAIRAGYGMYHEQVLNGMVLSIIGTNPPFQQTCAVTGVRLDNPTPGGCAVAAGNTVPNVRAIDPDWQTPYMQHWSLDLQHRLTSKTFLSIGYYGSKGTNLIGSTELNLLKPGEAINRGLTGCAVGASTTPTAPCQAVGQAFYSGTQQAILDQIRPFRGYRGITTVNTQFGSNYHSLQFSGEHRFTGASRVNVAYTWSKNLTNSQNDRSSAPINAADFDLEWGRAAFDRRHIFTTNLVYELPFYRSQQGFIGKILGGWQASSIVTFQTGLPFTATVSAFDPSGVGLIPPPTTVARPNVICDPNEGAPHTPQQWFNTACFQVTPVSGPVGNNEFPSGGRGTIHGPGTKRVDLTMMKNLRFSERFNLQLRAETFNIFNWTNPRGLSTLVWNTTTQPTCPQPAGGNPCGGNGTSTFGQVTSFRDPRVLQFGAKLTF